MADTMRSDFPDKFCASCGSKGCHILHWGPIMKGKRVYFDNCILMLGEDEPQLYDCETGQRTEEKYRPRATAEICFDYRGGLLWIERYTLSRTHGVGETFAKDSVTYRVERSKITEGLFGGCLVEHVVRIVKEGE